MKKINKLLNIPNSQLANVLRLSLHGLRATLQEALNTTTADDIGKDACRALLQDLDNLLQANRDIPVDEPSDLANNYFESNVSQQPLALVGQVLKTLNQALQQDSQLQPYLDPAPLHSADKAELWHEIQHLLLRIPANLAQDWQNQMQKELQKAGVRLNLHPPNGFDILPGISPLAGPSGNQTIHQNQDALVIVYPGLVDDARAKGLCLSRQAHLDHRLSNESLQGSDLTTLAEVVTICLHFVDHPDRDLHHALQSIEPFGFKLLSNSPQDQRKYTSALIDRFQRAQAAEKTQDRAKILTARLDLDEAIHSLIYLPPVERDTSWWGKLQQTARRTLIDKSRQYDIKLRALWGTYADIQKWSKNDLEINAGGIQGEVSACLRVYANLDKDSLLGRVIFRSFR